MHSPCLKCSSLLSLDLPLLLEELACGGAIPTYSLLFAGLDGGPEWSRWCPAALEMGEVWRGDSGGVGGGGVKGVVWREGGGSAKLTVIPEGNLVSALEPNSKTSLSNWRHSKHEEILLQADSKKSSAFAIWVEGVLGGAGSKTILGSIAPW